MGSCSKFSSVTCYDGPGELSHLCVHQLTHTATAVMGCAVAGCMGAADIMMYGS